MNLKKLEAKLKEIERRGFIPSMRSKSTGVGHTFEQLLGLSESNIPIPDIGGRVEIKTTRRDSSSLVTLFTFNRGAWLVKQKEVIEKYGYLDGKDRKALKSTLFINKSNSLGLVLDIDEETNFVKLSHKKGETIASWDLFKIVGKFSYKLSRVLFVIADNKKTKEKEEFHYNEAYLLVEPDVRKFLDCFKNSIIGIDLRMHLNENGSVRNRGTGFRMREADMLALYKEKRKLI